MSLPATEFENPDPARVRHNARAKANVRRMRARRAKGIRLVAIRLTEGEVLRLVSAGYLPSSGLGTIAAAVEAFLADHL
jgi:hypothetical protein